MLLVFGLLAMLLRWVHKHDRNPDAPQTGMFRMREGEDALDARRRERRREKEAGWWNRPVQR